MKPLFQDGLFADFGPSQVVPEGSSRMMRVAGARPAELRSQVRLLAPKCPGIYGFIDDRDQLLYVGKAKNLRTRLLSYFRRKGRPAKATKIVAQARSILWEILPSEFASLLRELELIRRWRPRWNVQGQPLRRRLAFVCIGRAPAPYIFLAGRLSTRVKSAFGPIPAGERSREAVRRLNDWFRLRDCPQQQEMIFPDQGELFPEVRAAGCLRMELGACLGPCTGTCTRRDYARQVRGAHDFLNGKDLSPLAELQQRMQAASDAQQFERASSLRDRWLALTWLADRLEHVRKARQEMSFIYPVTGMDGSTHWYFIHGARTLGVVPQPCDKAGHKAVREKVREIYRNQNGLLESYEHADSMTVVMSWFRRYPQERERCLCPQQIGAGHLP